MKLLVDGVAFQSAGSDSARIWQSILPLLALQDDLTIMVLDRGGMPTLDGVTRIPFPTYKHLYTADDSELIQQVCDYYAIDVFTSTQHTTPLSTPMFLVVQDMFPELLKVDPKHRRQQEKALAIAYARQHVCVSVKTRDDLLNFYPTLDCIDVAQAGIDHMMFQPVAGDRVDAFRRRIGFDKRPYLITYESHWGGAHGKLLFDTVAKFGIDAFDILCIGGTLPEDRRLATMLPAVVRFEQIEASGAELAVALSGAAALIHLVCYEGYGLPVLEAMACGCPVVTTANGALADVAGDACLIVDGTSRSMLAGALAQLRSDAVRDDLRYAGLACARTFDLSTLVTGIVTAARKAAALGYDADYRAFVDAWRSLRLMQAAVDTDTWAPGA